MSKIPDFIDFKGPVDSTLLAIIFGEITEDESIEPIESLSMFQVTSLHLSFPEWLERFRADSESLKGFTQAKSLTAFDEFDCLE